MRYAVISLLSVILAVSAATAGENLLKDGGFEQVLDRPDETGNPFKVWSGWKWEGNCQRAADTLFRHGGKSSALLSSYTRCKIALFDTFPSEAGFYKLTGYVRAINVKPGAQDWGVVVSFEPKGKEMLTNLPGGTYGWRKFEIVKNFAEACDKNQLYIY